MFTNNKKGCELYQLPLVDYEAARKIQHRLVEAHLQRQGVDTLILLEHPPVYTLGRGATTSFVRFTPNAETPKLLRIERGGEVTYHCPGQLVGYPILNLKHYQLDLHWYLRQLEEVIIQALKCWGLRGGRIRGLTGVWLDNYKVAAIGIKVSRWITMHGFAINVCPDLAGFANIVPCGIPDRPVGTLDQFCPGITVEQVRSAVAEAFADVFNVELRSGKLVWEWLHALTS